MKMMIRFYERNIAACINIADDVGQSTYAFSTAIDVAASRVFTSFIARKPAAY